MASICLCMIVKDEAAVIERCLSSLEGLIDSWVICDTGSADGTQGLIEAALVGVPGELHERPWVDFGHNRSELMRLARGRADYLLLLDADMTVIFEREGLGELGADSYMLRHAGELEYRIKRLVRGSRDWWYEGSTHEYLTTDGPETVENLDAIVVHHHADGGARADKFTRDRELLEGELLRDPNNARAVFYLGQTHRDLGDRARAIEFYERRALMGGWDEEVFYSLLQVGVLHGEAGDWPAAMLGLMRAWEQRPQRVEPLYELALGLRDRRLYRPAFMFARRGLDVPQPDDVLFVQPWVYRWGMLFEYSISAYWVGKHQAALGACDRLLKMRDLPEQHRAQTVENREFCLQGIQRERAPKLVLRGVPPARRERRARKGAH
jgi:glycosyltransferase involved in cell wall biosynthesis